MKRPKYVEKLGLINSYMHLHTFEICWRNLSFWDLSYVDFASNDFFLISTLLNITMS